MRVSFVSMVAALPAAALLAGCAMGTQGAAVPGSAATVPLAHEIRGQAHGGQQPVSNGVIAVYTVGTGGYGSAGTLLAQANADANGNFDFSYNCPANDPTAPVYVLSIGGQPGSGQPVNSAIVEGAGLGNCTASQSNYVDINEISTTILAYTLSHFFSAGSFDGVTSDFFGGPASLENALNRVTTHEIAALLDTQNSYPLPSTATFTNESAKILTIADILGACVNSSGSGSYSCTELFKDTTPSGGTAPTDVLQAAVNLALYPTQNVADLYSLVPSSGSSAFPGSLPSQPNDMTIAVSYTAPSLGLGIQSSTFSNLDIDTNGRVWFPSNFQGNGGVAYFDPSSNSFSPLFTAPGLTDPQQLAIDINGTVWVTDMSSDILAAFPSTSPGSPTELALPGYTTTTVTVLDDNSLAVGSIDQSDNIPGIIKITNTASPSYTVLRGSFLGNQQYFADASVAGDTVGGFALSSGYPPSPTTFDYYFNPNNQETLALYQFGKDAGQVAFNGADFLSTRGGYQPSDDGICDYGQQACFSMADQSALRHPTGMAIDGSGALWLADQFTGDVQEIPETSSSYLTGGLANNLVFKHDADNGGTMHTLTGIGIDTTGNVWATNESCVGTGCTPYGGLVLSEVIGAGTPTINPVAGQVVPDNGGPGTEPQSRSSRMPGR